ncbi:hypothetical protein CRM22_010874 [Opisthorchis felineus]|uniref:Uncharacterized protein n=1 Tax=Opisthorchis felineus TaxID=147828 RepID=A0A4S2KLD1_OPIFE|nr:hypothetical protein CRM22_010874 [Opisthorchis felineus]
MDLLSSHPNEVRGLFGSVQSFYWEFESKTLFQVVKAYKHMQSMISLSCSYHSPKSLQVNSTNAILHIQFTLAGRIPLEIDCSITGYTEILFLATVMKLLLVDGVVM